MLRLSQNSVANPRAWSIFLNGTPEEQEAFQDEIQQKISEQIKRDDRSPFTAEELSKFDVEELNEAA
jgi:predicted Zn-dependent peptidase